MTQLRSIYPGYRSRKSIILLVSLSVTLLLVILLVTFSFQYSTSANPSVSTPITNPHSSNSASQVLTTYYQDIMKSDYTSAYTLLSASVHQHLDLQGGATYLQNELEQFASRYGTITSYTVTQSLFDPKTRQITYSVRINRTKLTTQQTETDTYRLIQQVTTWAIDQWTSDVNTKP